ncbi:MAG TPA: leucyl aminopeptidase family protein [Rhodanobacteraceae bacterium]|nr:leucyl aminopeptidase family protein [Rhodanobacteraceae bacterium]
MQGLTTATRQSRATPIHTLEAGQLRRHEKQLGTTARRWIASNGFTAAPGSHLLLPDAAGKCAEVLAGVDAQDPLWAIAALPTRLPAGDYRLDPDSALRDRHLAALGWALGAYQFDRYRAADRAPARLQLPREELTALRPLVHAVTLVRDLVNTPTADLGPAELADAVLAIAKGPRARVRQWVGDDLRRHGFPTIHAVGRAATTPPRLIELAWGQRHAPEVAIVGKGVCFDTGGLDIKGADGMRWMKKDMGGAAHAIALATLVIEAGLPVRVRLLIPAVENAIAGNAMRPGEVIRTRAGLSVEVDNTDAEGRLILCDALAAAVETAPDLIIDFATLTGAARVALGPDLPALFGNHDAVAEGALAAAAEVHDPLWRLPLWQPYHRMLDSYLADTANSGPSRHAGAITAALYLQRFVPSSVPWLHLDTYAWNDQPRPGRPRGGEAMGLRAMFRFLQRRYG